MDNNKLLKIVIVVVVLFILYKYIQSRRTKKWPTPTPSGLPSAAESYVPFDEMPFDTVPPANATSAPVTSLTNVASDLLPKPTSAQAMDFGEFAPKSLQGQNFLEVSKQIGLDTQGSSMRNANYQLRADPPNPRVSVGPWMNSTIEADLLRRPLE